MNVKESEDDLHEIDQSRPVWPVRGGCAGRPCGMQNKRRFEAQSLTGMVGGGIHGQPAGYWSDDSSMTLCLADSIGKVGYYHTHDIMARFDDWIRNGAYTPGGKKFDVGHTCGYDSIPEEWLDALVNKKLIEECITGMEEYIDGL